jgi:putative hydrolase of the HAD superfamily
MAVEAVILDWGGTLTPWHSLDHEALWRAACAPHFPHERLPSVAAAIVAAENACWRQCESEHRSATLDHVFSRAGVTPHAELLDSYFRLWEPHTYTDPDVAPLLRTLRDRGIRVGVLSNTLWPRALHERVFLRDNVLDLIDGAVYSSEIPWTKPHPEAFRAAMAAVGVSDPAACVFVGDRPYDDIFGAKSLGMHTVLIPNSAVPRYADAVPDAVITRLADLLPHLDTWAAESF